MQHPRLLLRLAAAGREAIEREGVERRSAIEETASALSGVYEPGELARLRDDEWGVAWLATRDDGNAPVPKPEADRGSSTTQELGNMAAVSGHRFNGAGPMPGTTLEATESADGSVQVRYLEEGSEAGEQPAAFLTVGTYPLADPARALETFDEQPGSITRSRDGREVVSNTEMPTSVYFASPDNTVQVEVYDPSPKRALNLALSGQVHPAG